MKPPRSSTQHSTAALLAGLLVGSLALSACATDTSPTASPSTTPSTTPPSSSSPSAAEPSATESADEPALDAVAGLPTGPSPRIPYLDRGVLHRPDGTTVRSRAVRTIAGFGTVGDRILATGNGESLVRIALDAQGRKVSDGPGGSDVFATPDGSMAGWSQSDTWGGPYAPMLFAADGRSWAFPELGSSEYLVGFAGSDSCDGAGQAACTAYVVSPAGGDERGASYALSLDGTRTPLGVGTQVADVSARGELAGWIRPASLGRYNTAALWSGPGQLAWKARGYKLRAYSPRGRFVAGTLGSEKHQRVVILTRTGKGHVVLDLESRYLALAFAWEDERHVLVKLTSKGGDSLRSRQGLLRIGVDGSMEYAVALHPISEFGPRLLLPAD